jgi:hypothetical protein
MFEHRSETMTAPNVVTAVVFIGGLIFLASTSFALTVRILREFHLVRTTQTNRATRLI